MDVRRGGQAHPELRLAFRRPSTPTRTLDAVVCGFTRQWAAVNTLSGSIKVPPHEKPLPSLDLISKNAMKGYLPSATGVPPTILGSKSPRFAAPLSLGLKAGASLRSSVIRCPRPTCSSARAALSHCAKASKGTQRGAECR
jgi:hypothetical protein